MYRTFLNRVQHYAKCMYRYPDELVTFYRTHLLDNSNPWRRRLLGKRTTAKYALLSTTTAVVYYVQFMPEYDKIHPSKKLAYQTGHGFITFIGFASGFGLGYWIPHIWIMGCFALYGALHKIHKIDSKAGPHDPN